MCISLHRDTICLGDNVGNLHILNPKKNFEIAKSYASGHKKAIRGVHLSYDSLITSSTDGTIRVLSPTDPPRLIAVKSSGFGEIANVSTRTLTRN